MERAPGSLHDDEQPTRITHSQETRSQFQGRANNSPPCHRLDKLFPRRLLSNLTCVCLYVCPNSLRTAPPPTSNPTPPTACLPPHVCMLEQKDGCTVEATFVRDCATMQTSNQVASSEPSFPHCIKHLFTSHRASKLEDIS